MSFQVDFFNLNIEKENENKATIKNVNVHRSMIQFRIIDWKCNIKSSMKSFWNPHHNIYSAHSQLILHKWNTPLSLCFPNRSSSYTVRTPMVVRYWADFKPHLKQITMMLMYVLPLNRLWNSSQSWIRLWITWLKWERPSRGCICCMRGESLFV